MNIVDFPVTIATFQAKGRRLARDAYDLNGPGMTPFEVQRRFMTLLEREAEFREQMIANGVPAEAAEANARLIADEVAISFLIELTKLQVEGPLQ